MKIKAISRQFSDGEIIALKTEPSLTPEIFDAIERQELRPDLKALSLRTASGYLLINATSFTPELLASLDRLLTEAEDVVSGAAARRQEKQAKRDREVNVQSAASGFGLPIE